MKRTVIVLLLTVAATSVALSQRQVFDGASLGIRSDVELLNIVHDEDVFVVVAKGKDDKNQKQLLLSMIHPEKGVMNSYTLSNIATGGGIYHYSTKELFIAFYFVTNKSKMELHGVKFFKSGQAPEAITAPDEFRKLKDNSTLFNHKGQLKLLTAEKKEGVLRLKAFSENGSLVDQGAFKVSKEVLESIGGYMVCYPEQVAYDNSAFYRKAYVYSDSIILLRKSGKPFRSDFCVLNLTSGTASERSLTIPDTVRYYSVALMDNKIWMATYRSRVEKSKTFKSLAINVFNYETFARTLSIDIPLNAEQIPMVQSSFRDYKRNFFGALLEVKESDGKTVKDIIDDHDPYVGIAPIGDDKYLFEFGARFFLYHHSQAGASAYAEVIRMGLGCVDESLNPCPLELTKKAMRTRELEVLTKHAPNISEWELLALRNARYLVTKGQHGKGFAIFLLE